MTTTMSTTIHDYDTGAELSGTASKDLIEASRTESTGSGGAWAWRDESDVWQLTFADDVDRHARLGHAPTLVYVLEH